jgi:hypothetical protein
MAISGCLRRASYLAQHIHGATGALGQQLDPELLHAAPHVLGRLRLGHGPHHLRARRAPASAPLLPARADRPPVVVEQRGAGAGASERRW